MDRVAFANSLRGVAAVSVVIAHYLGVYWAAPAAIAQLTGMPPLPAEPAFELSLMPYFNFGPFGVGLFFLISGFVIPFSLARYSAAGFLVARVVRLYPTYLVGFGITILAIYIGSAVAGGRIPFGFEAALIHSIIGLRDVLWSQHIDGIVWTLETEIKFYLLCALAAVWFRAGSLNVFLIPIAAFAVVLALRDPSFHNSTRWLFLALHAPYLIFMFIGVAAHYLYRGLIHLKLFTVIVAALIAMFVASLFIGLFDMRHMVSSYLAAIAIFFACMRLPAIATKIPLSSFFAEISYPLYVVHGVAGYVVMNLFRLAGMDALIAIVATTILACGVAVLLHKCVEAPSVGIARKLAESTRPIRQLV